MSEAGDKAELISIGPGRVGVRGALTFETVARLQEEGVRALEAAAGEPLEMDLQGVTHADSAGLALLVGWLAEARGQGTTLRYSGLPERLLAIARISEVDSLLAAA